VAVIHLFQLLKTKYASNWGKKRPWQEFKVPEFPVKCYTVVPGPATWAVKTKDGIVLNNGQVDCVKGLNSFTFAFYFQESVLNFILE
jgi:hypothetical protein